MIKDRIESNKINKHRRFILISAMGMAVLSVIKLALAPEIGLTGLGFWIDTFMLTAIMIYILFSTQKEFKQRSGQFIEWTNKQLSYKLKTETALCEISLSDIQFIEITLDIIEIETKDQKRYYLDISDFEKYEDRMKIKNNFEKMKEVLDDNFKTVY